MPNTQLSDIQLDVTDTVLDLRTPRYRLHLPLSHKVDGQNAKAQWDKRTFTLSVTAKMVRDLDFLGL